MAEYLLYGFAQSGNSYKPALCLELAGADWAPRFVDYFNGETKTAAYRRINEMGEAPVLEHGSLRLSQSGVILDYLSEQLGKFGARDAAERREIFRWLLWDNHKLTGYTATYRFMRMFAPSNDAAVVAEFRGAHSFSPGSGNAPFDANSIDIYGNYKQGTPALQGDGTWQHDIRAADGARYLQVRFTFSNDVEAGLAPELDSFAFAYEK